MGRVIAISNQKGGVGKTTTAINLAAGLAAAEKSTLLRDIDPQGNAGSGMGLNRHGLDGASIYQVLLGELELSQIVRGTELPCLKIAPSGPALAGAEIELVTLEGRETRLKDALDKIKDRYDFVIIDCPPSLGLLTLNALTAADTVLIPMQCEYFAIEGLSSLLHTIGLVQQSLNPRLVREGILLTMFDGRNNLCRQVALDVRKHFKNEVFVSVIPRNIRLSEAPSHGMPAILYDVACKGSTAYLGLADEVIRRKHAA